MYFNFIAIKIEFSSYFNSIATKVKSLSIQIIAIIKGLIILRCLCSFFLDFCHRFDASCWKTLSSEN
jgi:hypothetical protein